MFFVHKQFPPHTRAHQPSQICCVSVRPERSPHYDRLCVSTQLTGSQCRGDGKKKLEQTLSSATTSRVVVLKLVGMYLAFVQPAPAHISCIKWLRLAEGACVSLCVRARESSPLCLSPYVILTFLKNCVVQVEWWAWSSCLDQACDWRVASWGIWSSLGVRLQFVCWLLQTFMGACRAGEQCEGAGSRRLAEEPVGNGLCVGSTILLVTGCGKWAGRTRGGSSPRVHGNGLSSAVSRSNRGFRWHHRAGSATG